MAQGSFLWTTSGTGDGPGGGFTQSHWETIFRKLLDEGVLEGIDSELAVSGDASPLSVAAGAAVVDGHVYYNNAAANVAVSTPSIGTTGHRVVIQADWTAQTARIALLSSSDGVATPPAVTQNSGSVYEISLATLTITTGGVITVTDDRSFIHYSTRVSAAMIDDDAVTTAKIADANVTTAKIADLAVQTAKIQNSGITTGKIADANVTTDKIADGAVTSAKLGAGSIDGSKITDGTLTTAKLQDSAVSTAKVANDAIDDTKAGNRVPQFYRRQGGSTTDWSAQGSTNYSPGAVRQQGGVIQWAGVNASSGSVAVTFPQAFSNKPIAVVTAKGSGEELIVNVETTASGLTIYWRSVTIQITTAEFFWFAVGPE